MHADVHHLLHTVQAAELHAGAGAVRLPRAGLRTRVGWALVEVGLRLTAQSRDTAAAAHRATAFHPA
ncbi:hypothetical protein AB0E21_25135 [Streptomyces sp. NPDC047967]|uniref:hypothetical protein n=1 Tax=unclassified Streptomyces TaxID=2593676 RepID=UPI003410BDA5